MNDFIVSARKYRPTSFDTVVGQDSITLTLKSAIKSNQLGQSFLFCGPRGVGKTSCARILAKAINCERISENIEACDSCNSCTSFNENASFNIHELDAASNNSVDDIRRLVDQVRFAPQVGTYSVYIIDEVHMLSASAFNAFLKTLEEPPIHAKFILATTEKHKIIPTILSRCQIFDFKRIGVNDIIQHLDAVAKSEGIKVDQEALHLIAYKSDGAMRDSLSLFDRLISWSDKTLSYKNAIKHLNILDFDYYFRITEDLINHNIHQVLDIYNEILENGHEGHDFINGLSEHLRDLLVSKDMKTIQLLEKAKDLQERYLSQSKACDLDFLLAALNLCNECDIQYKNASNQRLLVELTLVRISCIGDTVSGDQKKNSKIFNLDATEVKQEVVLTEAVPKSDEILEQQEPNNEVIHPKIDLDLVSAKKSSMISINSISEEDQPLEEITKQPVDVLEESDFSEDQLLDKWKELIQFVNQKGRSNLAITLGVYTPKLLRDCLIEISLSNKAQEEMIIEDKHMLLDYLRNKLKNKTIEITTKIVESIKNDIPYTDNDKFTEMLAINPQLGVLKQMLSLDPDY